MRHEPPARQAPIPPMSHHRPRVQNVGSESPPRPSSTCIETLSWPVYAPCPLITGAEHRGDSAYRSPAGRRCPSWRTPGLDDFARNLIVCRIGSSISRTDETPSLARKRSRRGTFGGSGLCRDNPKPPRWSGDVKTCKCRRHHRSAVAPGCHIPRLQHSAAE